MFSLNSVKVSLVLIKLNQRATRGCKKYMFMLLPSNISSISRNSSLDEQSTHPIFIPMLDPHIKHVFA